MYFYDVRKDYFQGYRHNLHPIYKAEGGKILKYNQCKPEIMYKKPMYTQQQLKTTSYDAQRYLMYSTQDYKEVLQTLQGLRCKPAVESLYYCINKSISAS